MTLGHAVVTGGSSGIGLAIARRLVQDGFTVTIVGRNEARLQQSCADIGEGVDFLLANVADRAEVNAMAQEAQRRHGEITVLVNNAGVMMHTTLDTDADELERLWDETMSINLKGMMFVTYAFAPFLKSPGGRVINMSSSTGHNGGSVPGLLAYAASKAGINGLTMALARELALRDITVNAVAPGMIEETGLTGTFDDERKERVKKILPLKRAGQPREIAAAVSYLASPDGGYVTGQVLGVNGGWIFR